MAWIHVYPPAGDVRNIYGNVQNNIRTLVDYTEDETSVDRHAALLQVTDYSQGGTDTITIDPSDTSSTTWTEGTDFDATTDNATTASNIASAINSTTDYSAAAVTGSSYDPWVSIEYTGSGHIDSASSGDTNAWSFTTVNAMNGTIAKIASDDTGTRKNQPLFTDSNGLFDFYLDNRGSFDVTFDSSDLSDYTDITAGGVNGLSYDETNNEVDLSQTLNANNNPLNNVSQMAYKTPQIFIPYGVNRTSSDRTIYVDTSTGSDSNDGSSGSPLATIQAAVDAIPDLIAHSIVIDIADGTYNETVSILGKIPVAVGASLTLSGNLSTPSNVQIAGTADSFALKVLNKSIVTVKGLLVKNTNTNGKGCLVDGYGTQLNIDSVRFDDNTLEGCIVQNLAYLDAGRNYYTANNNGEYGIYIDLSWAYLRSDGAGEVSNNTWVGIALNNAVIPKLQGIDIANNGQQGISLDSGSLVVGYGIEATTANTDQDIKATGHSKFIGRGSTTGTNILDRTLDPTTFDPTTTPADTSVVVDNR